MRPYFHVHPVPSGIAFNIANGDFRLAQGSSPPHTGFDNILVCQLLSAGADRQKKIAKEDRVKIAVIERKKNQQLKRD